MGKKKFLLLFYPYLLQLRLKTRLKTCLKIKVSKFDQKSNQIVTFMQLEQEKASRTELLLVNDGDTWLGLHYQGVLFPNISTHKYLVSWENNNLASTNTITQKENKKKQFLQKGFRNCKLIFSTLLGK